MIVWRSTHEALLAKEVALREAADGRVTEMRAELAEMKQDLERCKSREDRLMHEYVALATPKPLPVIPPREADPIQEAIRRRASGDGQLRAHLSYWAKGQKTAGAEVESIVKQIEDWTSAEQPSVFPW